MRPQIQLLDPDVVVDLARRGAREGLEVDLRRRRGGVPVRADASAARGSRGSKRRDRSDGVGAKPPSRHAIEQKA